MCLLSKAIDTGLSRWEFPHWMDPFHQSGDCWYAERDLPACISEGAHHMLHSQIFTAIKKYMKKEVKRIQPLVVTLNLCLVHNKILLIPAVLELFALTAVQTHVLIFRLVEGEERGRVAAVTSIPWQHG